MSEQSRGDPEPFVPSFPKELFVPEQMSAERFAADFGFVHRVLFSGLPHGSRAKYLLQSADRLRLPFAAGAFLWRFTFQDRSSAPESPEITTCLMFEAGEVFVPVDFTDRSFAAAIAAMVDVDVSSAMLREAFVATYYAVSRTRRSRQWFYPSFRTAPRPAEIDEAKWTQAIDEATAFCTQLQSEDLHLHVDRKEGEVVVFSLGYRATSVFGTIVPSELQKRVVLKDDALIQTPASTPVLWRSCGHELLALRSSERRDVREADAREAIRGYLKWRPAGFEGDLAPITEAASTLHRDRRERFPWMLLLDAGRRSQSPEHCAELAEFLVAVQGRCSDYSVPAAALRACHPDVPASELSQLELTVLRRSLAFYPSHRLYELVDRRGGRPRKTQFLFAPANERVPEAVDRLIPLNGVSLTCHMLNAAYKIHLTDLEAVEYLDFFCDTVTGGEGVFHLMETPDDVRWRGQAPEQRTVVAQVATPIRLWPGTDEHAVVLDALLTYSNVLFHAEFKVMRNGNVEMVSDRPIFDRLEVAPELFTARTHFFLRPPTNFVVSDEWSSRAFKQ